MYTESKILNGLSKREHFAALALQGYLSGRTHLDKPVDAAKLCLEYADAVLALLRATAPPPDQF